MSVAQIKQPVTAAPPQELATTKPLRRHCLYAVFEDEVSRQRAEAALVSAGLQPQRLGTCKRGLSGRIERFMMRFGDDLPGVQHYAMYAESGQCVLAVPAHGRHEALRLANTLAAFGAYDVTYFGPWTAEPIGPLQPEEPARPS